MPRLRKYKFNYFAEKCLEAWERDQPRYIAVDTETSGFTWEDRPFCVTVSWVVGSGDMVCIGPGPGPKNVLAEDGVVYPYMKWKYKVKGRPERIESHYLELGETVFAEHVAETLLHHTPELVFHNAKFDLRMLIQAGLFDRDELDPSTLHDTEALAHLLDEHRRKGLKPLARTVLGEETDEETAIKEAQKAVKKALGLRSIKDVSYDMLPRPTVLPYALKDAEYTIRLFHEFYPKVKAMESPSKGIPSLYELYRNEMELTLVLLDMETAGLGVDEEYVERTAKEYARKAFTLELEIRDMVGREDFNPNSPKQLKEAFAERGIMLSKTDKQTLREVDDPLAELVMELRTVKKMRSTYLAPMLDETIDGVLHPNFRQHGTKTGRMSSGAASN